MEWKCLFHTLFYQVVKKTNMALKMTLISLIFKYSLTLLIILVTI
jgi:hypothetical protein